jgi:hypothetical protein
VSHAGFGVLGAIGWGDLGQLASAVFSAVAAAAAALAALSTRSELRDQRLVRELNALEKVHDRIVLLVQAARATASHGDQAEFESRKAGLTSALNSTTFVLPECALISHGSLSEVRDHWAAAGREVEAAIERKAHELNPSAEPIEWSDWGSSGSSDWGSESEGWESESSGWGGASSKGKEGGPDSSTT